MTRECPQVTMPTCWLRLQEVPAPARAGSCPEPHHDQPAATQDAFCGRRCASARRSGPVWVQQNTHRWPCLSPAATVRHDRARNELQPIINNITYATRGQAGQGGAAGLQTGQRCTSQDVQTPALGQARALQRPGKPKQQCKQCSAQKQAARKHEIWCPVRGATGHLST